jgi:hypothetical protein
VGAHVFSAAQFSVVESRLQELLLAVECLKKKHQAAWSNHQSSSCGGADGGKNWKKALSKVEWMLVAALWWLAWAEGKLKVVVVEG